MSILKNLSCLLEKYDTLVFFDTETTGFSADKECIIELACIQVTKGGDNWHSFDKFVMPYDHRPVPENITEITSITDKDVYESNDSVSEREAVMLFSNFLSSGKTLLIAHNAQFDLAFVRSLITRAGTASDMALFDSADYMDSLTIVKDRKAYPHKLCNCIEYYGLEDVVKNSHRAVDDTLALAYVVDAMAAEREDLAEYVNVFGYNPRYGLSGKQVDKINYKPQPYSNYMVNPSQILPRK